MLESLPQKVTVYEVGPRDGLQNESARIPVDHKLELIAALADAGLRRIEATSFVSPRWIPQLADAGELAPRLPRRAGVVYSALVPNERGLHRAHDAGISEAAIFLSASETHSRKNINKSIREAVDGYAKLCPQALALGMTVRGYVSTVWGCPYEGEVSVKGVVELVERLLEMGCNQVSLGDTIGVGNPRQTERILGAVLAKVPARRVAMHMHDTRGQALANVLVGLTMGITTFDSSVGGLGGCPYAPGASGNLASEDLVNMLQGMGIETGVDLPLLVDAARLAERMVGHELPSKVMRAAIGEMEISFRKR